MKTSLALMALEKLPAAAAARLAHRHPIRHRTGLGKVLAVVILLAGLGCPAGRAQTMETITNSLIAIEGLLANVSPDQTDVYVGDMGFSQTSLRAWTGQLRQMAGLPTGPLPKAIFDLNYAAWTGGVVPYTYAPNMPAATINTFEAAMREWQKAGNLKFIQATISDANYIYVQTNTGGNSYVGMRGGAQVINIDASASLVECAHELGHALGMEHEQCRTDRDTYVKMHWQNFKASLGDPRTNINFAIVFNSTNFGAYDYSSIQEYPTVDGNTVRAAGDPACDDPTCIQIEPLDPYYTLAGRPYMYWGATNLSAGDKVGMAGRYGVPRIISGHVVNGANASFAGVTVAISGGVSYRGPVSVMTDANGNYSFIGIPNNSGTFTVSASFAGHSFTPGGWNVTFGTTDSTTANFNDSDTNPPLVAVTSPANGSATALLTSISGTASDIGTGLLGNQIHFTLFNNAGNFWSGIYWTNTSASDPSILLTAAVVNGTWAFTNVPAGGNQSQGPYYISAFAQDNAGNLSTPQSGVNSTSFTISTTPPNVAIISPLNGITITNQPGGNWFQGTASGNLGISVGVNLFIRRNSDNLYWTGSGWGNVTNGFISNTYNANTHLWQSTGALPVPGSSLGNGDYHFIAIATDAAGNTQQVDSVVSVDFHPIYIFTYGSQPGPNPSMNWNDSRNWDVGSVPTPDAWVIINNFSPDNTGLGNFSLYRLDISGGQLTTAGMLIQKLNLSGGTITGGTIAMTANGVFNWSGGTLTGAYNIPVGATLNLSGSADKTLSYATLVNSGTVIWNGGNLLATCESAITNNANFIIQSSGLLNNNGGGYYSSQPLPVFVNNGWLQKTNSNGNITIAADYGGWIFDQNGTIDVENGTLSSLSQFYVNGGAVFSGAGETRVDGGTIVINGTNTIQAGATVELASGSVGGTNVFAGSGVFNWSGGSMAARLRLQAGVGLNISGGADKTLSRSSSLTLGGSTLWTGAGRISAAFTSVITNNGTFTVQNDSSYLNSGDGYYDGGLPLPIFVNNGTWLKNTTTGTTVFDFNYGGVAFNNNGTVDLQTGSLAINGGYSLSGSTQLKLVLGGLNPGTQFSQETSAGVASLGGILSVTLTNGFAPTNGQSFALATYPSSTGQFTSTQFPPLPVEVRWQLTYGANSLLLQVVPSNVFQSSSVTNGNFQFAFQGQTGSSCLIEVSTNLFDWAPLLTNAPFNGNLNYVDPQTPLFSNRFYRATIFP